MLPVHRSYPSGAASCNDKGAVAPALCFNCEKAPGVEERLTLRTCYSPLEPSCTFVRAIEGLAAARIDERTRHGTCMCMLV